jgi:cell division septal protein FtsQ
MTKASPAEKSPDSATRPRRSAGGLSLWLWVVAAFLFMAVLWAAIIAAARRADIRDVPVATSGGEP